MTAGPAASDSPLPTLVTDALSAEPRSVYLHVPFCAHRCGYCDFAAIAGADHLADRYLGALERELALRLPAARAPRPVETIFIGGGTPTRLTAEQLERLLALIRRHFEPLPNGEWTVEANPGTLDAAKIETLVNGGVNRISLGAQSFQRPLLEALERNHDPDDIPRAVERIRPHFDRWSLDLIFGAPGSTADEWRRDLETALALEPSHLSCYGLVYEKGTPLWKQLQAGSVEPVPEETEAWMYEYTIDRLTEAGLPPYEISNFAKPGHACRHNLAYWANASYEGFGVGAARYVNGVRAVNTRDLNMYLKRLEAGVDPTGPTERLAPEARAKETAVLMLRRLELGIDREEFRQRTGFALEALCGEALAAGRRRGQLEDDGRRVRLTRSALPISDSVMSTFL